MKVTITPYNIDVAAADNAITIYTSGLTPGAAGADGTDGATGAKGDTGDTGPAGADATISEVEVTIAIADWEGGLTCTKTVAGLLVTSTFFPSYDRTNEALVSAFGLRAEDSTILNELPFTVKDTTPTSEIVLTVSILT